jgi:sugar (pentulose or hexulose) kinase
VTSSPRRLALAIDCSTTAVKAVVFDEDGQTVALARVLLAMSTPRPGWHEQDARAWWTATADAVREAMAQLEDPESVIGMAITHQRESFVCLGADGEPLRPAILWLDGRATQEIADYGHDDLHALTGKPADITPSIYKLAWVRRHEPDTLRAATRVAEVSSYLSLHLTGRFTCSDASADTLGLFDLGSRTWDDAALEIAGARRDQLPDLVPVGQVIGEILPDVCRHLGLPQGTPLVAGLGDGQAGGLGAAVTGAGSAYLNLGTATVIGVQFEDYTWGPQFRTLVGTPPGCFTLETWTSSGTYLTNWFRRELGDPSLHGAPDPELDAAASLIAPGCDGLLTLPYWNAAQTPYWDPHARGAMIGWHGAHTRAHAYRSVLEGIAYELRLHLEGLEHATGQRIDVLRAMGGGTRSVLWTQLVADVTQRRIEICVEEEIAALGAAVVVHSSPQLGGSDIHEVAERMAVLGRVVEPNPDLADAYAQLYAVHRRLYPLLRDLFPALGEVRSAVPATTGITRPIRPPVDPSPTGAPPPEHDTTVDRHE